MIKPLSHFIVVIKKEADNTTNDGLLLPESSKEKPLIAKVQAIGLEVDSVQVGDSIIYKQYETDVEIENIRYLIIKDQDILAIL